MVTSNWPSEGSASGATRMPPPKYWPLATARVVMASGSSGPPSTRMRTAWSRQPRRVRTLAGEEPPFPAEGLGPGVDRAIHLPADPEAGDVHEVPLAGAAVGPGEADAADVERGNGAR